MSDKHELLDEVSKVIDRRSNFGLRHFLSTLLLVSLVFLTVFPKVYLQTQVYYKSRDIDTLKREYQLLKEENKIIKRKVENIKFKNQILDTLF